MRLVLGPCCDDETRQEETVRLNIGFFFFFFFFLGQIRLWDCLSGIQQGIQQGSQCTIQCYSVLRIRTLDNIQDCTSDALLLYSDICQDGLKFMYKHNGNLA